MGLRVTDAGLSAARRMWISEGKNRLADAERALSTGRQLNQPSDDPTAATQLLRHEVRLDRIEQFNRNTDNARLWVGAADESLQAVANNMGRAKTLAIQAGNDTLGQVENAALAADIRAIADEMLAAANSKASGRVIFAGTADTPQAYDVDGNYLGDLGSVVRTIDTNEDIRVGVPGPEVFGTANPGDPFNGSVFEVLHALADAVEADNQPQVQAGITAVNVATARVASGQGKVGAISQQLDAADLRLGGEKLAVQSNVSELRDTDIAEAVIRLRSAETSYEATLSATARALSRSLLDFLR